MTRQSEAGSGSALMVSAIAGAVLGAAGLAWWLLSEAERRRAQPRQGRPLRLSQLSELGDLDASSDLNGRPIAGERELHDKVHELNQAIDDVRRQLESLESR